MSVEVWFRDSLETETFAGDLTDLTNGLNIAAAQGKQFTLFQDLRGQAVMVQTQNIVKAREMEEDDALIGGR